MPMLKIWYYLNYKDHFYLCEQRKMNAFLDVYGRFWKVSQSCNMFRRRFRRRFRRIVTCYNWASSVAVESLLFADML